jgi:tagatose-6-phosphate ketose/aldose isomerase
MVDSGEETMQEALMGIAAAGSHTGSEILQQPELWLSTPDRATKAAESLQLFPLLQHARVLVTGAGTSAYAAHAIATAWPRAISVPSTDLLVDTERYIAEVDLVISIGRSGNSPESIAVVNRIHSLRPEIMQFAITCNSKGALATSPLVSAIVLDPRTDDRSLVMTSSFSNLVLAGLSLMNKSAVESMLANACSNAQALFTTLNMEVSQIAKAVKDRVVLLASPPLFAWAQEGALKSLEMTAGNIPILAETYLGLRHGPMSFVRPDTVIMCLLSNDSVRRRYEKDLIAELRAKNLGFLVGIGATSSEASLFDTTLPAIAPGCSDRLRTPFEIMGPQLLGYHLSLLAGLNPDNPSPEGVINRVVEGVNIYENA